MCQYQKKLNKPKKNFEQLENIYETTLAICIAKSRQKGNIEREIFYCYQIKFEYEFHTLLEACGFRDFDSW